MVMATMLLNQERKDVIALGSSRAESLSQVAATCIDQTFLEIDLGMADPRCRPRLARQSLDLTLETLMALLARLGHSIGVLDSIAVLDVDGDLIANKNGAAGEPQNFADRLYFQYHAAQATENLRVGAPLLSRPQGTRHSRDARA